MMNREKVADLTNGLSIWTVHLDCIREQDKNARVMTPEKFNRLAENIRQGARLESLPFTFNEKPEDITTEFLLVSGHHRVRAARKAGLQVIFILNGQNPMTRSEMVAKQLAHNSLSGYDDKNLWQAIEL